MLGAIPRMLHDVVGAILGWAELGYVSEAVALVANHFADRIPVIGFCGAPFTLASYMIEGGGSRNYVHAKKMMYNNPAEWDALMGKLVLPR